MKKVIILGIMTIGFSGASLNNATPTMKIHQEEVKDSINIDTIPDKLHRLDSILIEINKLENEK